MYLLTPWLLHSLVKYLLKLFPAFLFHYLLSLFFPRCSFCSVHFVFHLINRCLPQGGDDILPCYLTGASLCWFSPLHLQLLWGWYEIRMGFNFFLEEYPSDPASFVEKAIFASSVLRCWLSHKSSCHMDWSVSGLLFCPIRLIVFLGENTVFSLFF